MRRSRIFPQANKFTCAENSYTLAPFLNPKLLKTPCCFGIFEGLPSLRWLGRRTPGLHTAPDGACTHYSFIHTNLCCLWMFGGLSSLRWLGRRTPGLFQSLDWSLRNVAARCLRWEDTVTTAKQGVPCSYPCGIRPRETLFPPD